MKFIPAYAMKKIVFCPFGYFLLQLLYISSWSGKMIYKLVWLLLQTLVTIYNWVLQFSRRLQLIRRSYDQKHNTNKNFQSDCDIVFLEHCKTELTKIPQHISIIIGPDEQTESELISRIIRYSLFMEVNCISLYDARESEERRIDIQNVQPPKDVFSKQLGEKHLVWKTHDVNYEKNGKFISSDCNSYAAANGFLNGHRKSQITEKSIEIYEFALCEGQKLIGKVCRELYTKRHTDDIKKLLQDRTQLMQRIDETMSQHLWKTKDPELCVIIGKHMCTFGLLPWQTRFTEFYLYKNESLFDAKTFAKILYQYSRCEQRWGK